MSVNAVNSDGSLLRVAGGTLYADAPIGTISPFGGSVVPSGYLLCNGQAVSRTSYKELFATIGVAFGSGDGSTTFNVPDLRETVPVGSGTRGSGVEEHDTYNIGEFKDDQMQSHNHYESANAGGASQVWGNIASSSGQVTGWYTGYIREGRSGTTTHGKQLGVNYIIKAKQVAVPADFVDAIDDAVESELEIKDITLTKVNVASSTGAWAKRSGSVVNINLAALLTLDQTTPNGTILLSGLPKPAFDVIRFGLYDASAIDIFTGLVQVNSNGHLVADGQGLKQNTVYWGSFTYLTNE